MKKFTIHKNGYWALLFFSLISIIVLASCDQESDRRKIKLSRPSADTQTNQRFTSTIHLEPTLRRAIAIMFFENKTGDQDLQWLQKGLTEMLIRSLSQSRSLSVLSTDQVFSILDRLERKVSRPFDLEMAAMVAREANVEALLTGKIAKNGDSLQITVQVHEPNQGKILTQESVEGPGLEAIFAMVDDLTQKIKQTLQIALEKEASSITDLSTNSLEAWRHYTMGVDLMNSAMFNDAIPQFEQAVALDPNFISAYYRLCLLFIILGERQKCLDHLSILQALKSRASPREQYQIDRLESNVNRDIRKMIDTSRRWIEQNPDDVEANFNLGDIFFALQNYDQAIRYYQAALNVDPQFKPAYNMIGYCNARKGDIASAIAILKRYQKLAPADPNAYDSMGEIYYNHGDFQRAEKQFKRALKLNENFTSSWLSLGDVYLDQGKFEQADPLFQQFLAKAQRPRPQADGYAELATAQWRRGNIDQAIESLHKMAETQIGSYRAITWINELYLEKNDRVGAANALEKNYQMLKDFVLEEPIYLNDLASLSLSYDINKSETIDIIRQILKQDNRASVQMRGSFYLALLYLKTNQFGEYQKISDKFVAEFSRLLLDAREAPMGHETWKKFLIFNVYAYQSMTEGIEKYRQFIQYCQDHDLTLPEMIFRMLLVDLYLNRGELNPAEEQLKIVGVPEEKNWLVIAPFDNTNGFHKRYPPEREIKLNKAYPERNTVLRWQSVSDGFNEGYINLKQIYPKYNWSVAYGLIYVRSAKKQTVQIRLGTNDSVRLWLNDNEVWRMNIGRDAIFDNDIIPVVLQLGLNKILLKVCNRINEWGFYFRITDENGRGLPTLEFVSAGNAHF